MRSQPQPREPEEGNVYRLPTRAPEVVTTQILLQPIAPPSVLGLYGFAIAASITSLNLIVLYGTPQSPSFLFPFAAITGGILQLVTSMWAFRARDTLATAMLGVWGAFWIGYGILWLLVANGTLTIPTGAFPEFGFWYLPLAVITLTGAIGATRVSVALTVTLFFLGLGALLGGIGNISGSTAIVIAGGYSFLISAAAGYWTATGLMFKTLFGRSILPLGSAKPQPDLSLAAGEPGVIRGQ